MSKLPVAKPKEIIKALRKLDFIEVRQKGSHIQMKRGSLLVLVPLHHRRLNPNTTKINFKTS